MANYLTGTPSATCGAAYGSGTVYVAGAQSTVAPPSAMNAGMAINGKGQGQYSAGSMGSGGNGGEYHSTTFGTRNEIAEPVYWLEVPRDVHQCRHVSGANCE